MITKYKIDMWVAVSIMLIGVFIGLAGILKTDSWMSVAGFWQVIASSYFITNIKEEDEEKDKEKE